MKRKQIKMLKHRIYDALTGKVLNNCKQVIDVKNAKDWCIKEGYIVRLPTISDLMNAVLLERIEVKA